jgi:hypothetical protein
MVTEILVKESLSDRMVSAGSDLVRRLDQAGLTVTAALWFYDPEANSWRLIIGSPDVGTRGLKAIYGEVQSVLVTLPEDQSIPFKDISVVDADDPLIALLRGAIRTGDGIAGITFSRNMINGTLIEDSFIYRLT